MKKNILVLFMFTFVFFQSCDKWVDVRTTNGVTNDEYWKSAKDAESVIATCYDLMRDIEFIQRIFAYTEMRSDQLTYDPSPTNGFNSIQVGNVLSSNTVFDWSIFYKIINNSNLVITNVEKIRDTDPEFTEEKMNSTKAEALYIRSLMYFYLVRTFGEVPLILEPSLTDEQEYFVKKETVPNIYTQIVTDLNFCVKNMAYSYSGVELFQTGRANRYAGFALLADVSLWTKQYNVTIECCDSIRNSNKYRLLTTAAELVFSNNYSSINSYYNSEIIFEVYMGRVANWYSYRIPTACNLSYTAYTMFDKKDIRGYQNVFYDNEIEAGDLNSYCYKFFYNYSAFKVYRYAEVFLMSAEAKFRLGNASALEDLNYLQKQRSVDDVNIATEVNNQTLLDERGRELINECKRWYDILRFAKYNYNENMGIITERLTVNILPEQVSDVTNKLSDTLSHYFPNYSKEIKRNKNLVQNPYYINL